MSLWRPSLAELVSPFVRVRPWNFSVERYKKGIDNANVDVYLSSRLREAVREIARKLILRDIRVQARFADTEPIRALDLKALQESYVGIFEAISGQSGPRPRADDLALLQISLLKYLIETVARETTGLQQAFKVALSQETTRASGRSHQVQAHLFTLVRDEHAVNRHTLNSLFRQLRELEGTQVQKVRASLGGEPWPFPKRAFFNPVLTVPDLDEVQELAPVYPIAGLGEGGDTDWLFQTNQCVSTVFQHYLPPWTRFSSAGGWNERGAPIETRERRDRGQLRGFLGTEMVLSRFVPEKEFREGRSSWLDEPENLRLFLASGRDRSDAAVDPTDSVFGDVTEYDFGVSRDIGCDHSQLSGGGDGADEGALWTQAGWQDFQAAVVDELHRCLDLKALSQRIILLNWLPRIGNRLGRPVPLSLVCDFVAGRLSRRRLAQRLEALHLTLEPATVARLLEGVASRLKRLGTPTKAQYLGAYLVDFLLLRRDLKLAYKTFEAMDSLRLLEEPEEIQLSRANDTLYEFPGPEERPRSKRSIIAHTVLKADVRGSTRITEGLRAKGLNPASHFGMNFFDPVNRLLQEFGGEKLFVEGDAVIIAMFEHEGEAAAMTVSRACGLARKMLQVVSLQNAVNRKHALPELELGLGISFSDREPNFLYDEGRRIMISGAINRADRLSSCAASLRTGAFRPADKAFRVEVVRDTSHGPYALHKRDSFLSYNVNGIKLEKAAFFKLQREMNLRQVRLPDLAMGDGLFFVGSFTDLAGREHWLVLRYAPIREWHGDSLGTVDPDRGHFFEVIADEALSTRVRKLAGGKNGLPLRGRE